MLLPMELPAVRAVLATNAMMPTTTATTISSAPKTMQITPTAAPSMRPGYGVRLPVTARPVGQVGRCSCPLTVDDVRRRPRDHYRRVLAATAELDLPPAVFKTCPWQPQALVETGLRQWLRCCAPALRDNQVIGMPSRAVDEAWHGLILCTALYSAFCDKAYGEFLHHYPEGGATADIRGANDSAGEQLRRTVIAWSLVAQPGERCVLWDLDQRVAVDQPWGIDADRVAEIEAAIASL
jgi:hypothetical protein